MLALPEFRDVAGRRVLLVKGEGGRDLMRREFATRGAEVLELAVYRRCQAAPTPDVQRELQRALGKAGTWIAATSAEVLDALVQLVGDEWRSPLLESALLVPGDRVAGVARQLGWRGPVVTAPTAEDATMLEALRQHVAGPHATP
jgi:uroporphyrinogen-III synthase